MSAKDGVFNAQDDYILTRLENALFDVPLYNKNDGTPVIDPKTGKQDVIPKIDTVVVAPHDFQKGIMDGSKDKEGNYYKVTAKEEFGAVGYIVKEGSMEIVFGKIKNELGDALKNGNEIKSGYKPAGSPDAIKLEKEWGQQFKDDIGSHTWEKVYDTNEQYSLRKLLNEGQQKNYSNKNNSNSQSVSFNLPNNNSSRSINIKDSISNTINGLVENVVTGFKNLYKPTGCTK